MRRWKEIGSVQSIHSRDNSEARSNRSRKDSPFRSFHQNLQNKSDQLDPNERTFCQDYMERYRESAKTLTFDNERVSRGNRNSINSIRGGDDMFTQIRQVLKEDNDSRVTTKSLSDPDLKTLNGQSKTKNRELKRQKVKKTNEKVRCLKKQQGKIKRKLETDMNSIKNIFYQLEDVFHNYKNIQEKQPEPQLSSGQSYDPDFLKQILTEAMSVQSYFADIERKKRDVMTALENDHR